jgi:hypothetical protein
MGNEFNVESGKKVLRKWLVGHDAATAPFVGIKRVGKGIWLFISLTRKIGHDNIKSYRS